MPTLQSSQPTPTLRPYVRAYAQRRVAAADPILIEPVPAQLEQVMNFELGILPGVRHRESEIANNVWIGGAQTSFPGHMHLWPGVESFAIFFQPMGWSQLFGVPMYEITNRIYDASSIIGSSMMALWNRLGEAPSFELRVAIVEEFLLNCMVRKTPQHRMAPAVMYLFRQHGAVRIPTVGHQHCLSLRQFERLFHRETGASPKAFARVARFQAALTRSLPRQSAAGSTSPTASDITIKCIWCTTLKSWVIIHLVISLRKWEMCVHRL